MISATRKDAVHFEEPADLAEAHRLLAADPEGAQALSGGTAVVLMMRQGLIEPDSLVSLARLPELRGIDVVEGDRPTVRIGASSTLREVAASPVVQQHLPALARACGVVGNPRIRNVATLGGNLAEADYASDPPSVLAALGAEVAVAGPRGRRTIDAFDVITGYYETVLEQGELITHVDLSVRPDRRQTYLKYRSRSSEDRACVGVAARADLDEAGIVSLDVVVGAVASRLQRVPEVLADVVGRPLDAATARTVATAYAEAIDPLDDARGSAWYRRRMLAVFVRRAIEDLGTPNDQRVPA